MAAPIVGATVPGAAGVIAVLDPIFQNLQVAIQTAETQSPEGGGAVKAGAVHASFDADLQITQSVLAMEGKTLQYNNDKLQSGITNQVAALNDWADLKASFKIVDLPKPAAAVVAK